MTVTEAPPQESATEYPLDTVIAGLEGILAELREAAGHTDGAAALKLRAALARLAAAELEGLPLPLHQEALECDAEAAATEAAGGAREALGQAADALKDAEEAFARTSEPEQAAAKTATTARQLAEAARDALAQAERDGAEPAALAELHGRTRDTAAVLEHEARKLAGVQAERQSARDALDRARAAHRKAQENMTAAEDAVAHPSPASLSRVDLATALMFGWQRLLFSGEPLSADLMQICRYHACAIVDDFGWTPPRAEARIRQQIAREMIATARKGRAVEISYGKGTVRLVANPLGMMGASQVATVAQAR